LPFAKHCAPKKGSQSVFEKKPKAFVDEIDPRGESVGEREERHKKAKNR